MQTPIQLYVSIDGKHHGPYSHDEVRQYLSTGQLQPQMPAWGDGMTDWLPLETFPEFAATGAKTASRGRRSRTGLYVSLAVGAAALCAVGGWLVWRARQSTGTDDTTSTATAAPAANTNWPKTLAELNAWYVEPPAGKNAAEIFLQGFEAMSGPISNNNKNVNLPLIGATPNPRRGGLPTTAIGGTIAVSSPDPGSPVPAPMKTAIAAFMQQTQPAWDLFEKASSLPQCRYPVDLTKGRDAVLSHLAHVRQAATVSAVFALGYADTQRGKEAGESVFIAYAIGRSLQAEPALLSQMTRNVCNQWALKSLEQTLNRVALPSQTLTRLQDILGQMADREAGGESFNRAFAGEKLMAMSLFSSDELQKKLDTASPEDLQDFQRELDSRDVPKTGTLKERAMLFMQKAAQDTANGYDQLLAARQTPFPARLTAIDANKQTDLKATSKEAQDLARLRLAQTAVALERFRASGGKGYPDNLAALSPKYLRSVPQDPFDGQPLRYAKSGDGYTLHSAGQTGDTDAVLKTMIFTVTNPPKPASK
jgi:hypothetical protein